MSNSLKKVLTIAIAVVVVGLGAFLFGKQLKATDDNGEYADAPVIEVAVDEVVIEETQTEEQSETSEELEADSESAEEENVPEIVEEETEEQAETEEVTEAEEITEPEEIVTESETEPEVVNRKVEIWTDRKPVLSEGEEVHLFSKLTGFEGVDVKYQWQCNKGNGFEDVPGATGSTYTYSATKESLSWSWRLMINY